jgi:hypothetical protein
LRIRRVISWLNSYNQCIATFKSFYIAHGLRPCKFSLDMDVRWNATYLMLKQLVPYKTTFSMYVSANYQVGGEPLLTEEHWYVVEHILKFFRFILSINYFTIWCLLSNISFNDACYY